MLAVADNDKLAEIYGISAKRAYLLSGIVAAVLICAGVYLYGTRAGVTPDVPIGLILTAVIATLVGGLGRIFSAGHRGGRAGAAAKLQHPVHPGEVAGAAAVFRAVLRARAVPARHSASGASAAPSRWRRCPWRRRGTEPMEYLASAGMLIGIYIILAASYNLIIGYGGLNTIAHPIFFALGAYTARCSASTPRCRRSSACWRASASRWSRRSRWRSRRCGIEGDYLLIASLGFQLGLLQPVNNFEFTGGPAGLSNIPVTITGPGRGWLYLLICAGLAVDRGVADLAGDGADRSAARCGRCATTNWPVPRSDAACSP